MDELPISAERLAELAEPLGEDARVILDRFIAADWASDQTDPAVVLEGFAELPQEEKDQLMRIVLAFHEARRQAKEEDEGMLSLLKQVESIHVRARELEPSLPETATIGDAYRVLERHGVNPGISEEALQIKLRVLVDPEDS